MEKRVTKRKKDDTRKMILEDRDYWLSRPPAERIEAVEILRKQYFNGNIPRLQRVAKVIKLTRS